MNPFEPSEAEAETKSEAEETAKYFVQVWAEAVIRQAERTRAIRTNSAMDDRAYDRAEEWSPHESQLFHNFRVQWAEEHMLVWPLTNWSDGASVWRSSDRSRGPRKTRI